MRKLLLASAAVIGGFAGGQAIAQTAVTAPLPPTWTEAPQPTAPSGIAAGNSNLSAQGFYTKGPLPAPTPGSVVVRFNGRIVFYGFAAQQNGNHNGEYKNQPDGTMGYFRFYTGIDGLTTSGLRYGAAAEIRQNDQQSSPSATSGGASGASFGGTLYVRRAFAYIGGDWGAIHFGQDDGPMGLLDAGVTTFQTYNDGGWNDDLNDIADRNTPTFPFPSGIGNEYATSKVVYLSPQIAGFDFMGSFEPTDNPLADCCSAPNSGGVSSVINPAGPSSVSGIGGSFQLSSSPALVDQARRRNTFEAGARYQGAFGPAGLYAFASYVGSGRVNNSIGGAHFDDLSAFFGGVAVNFGGFRVGGSYLGGAMNNQMALKPVGGADERAWLVGAQYTLGPMTIGASYFDDISAGATLASGAPLASQRRQGGINVGGTYVFAPGLLAWVSASYGKLYQGDYNFVSGTVGSPVSNTVLWKAVAIGGMVRW